MNRTQERDKKISDRVDVLLKSEFKELNATEPHTAFRRALSKAAKEIPIETAGDDKAKSAAATSQATRDDPFHALTLKLLAEDPELKALAARDEYAAFKAAMHKAKRAGEAALSLAPDGPTAAAIKRAKQVHKIAMIQLSTDATLRDRAAVNYPEGFELSHSAADTYGDDYCFVPSKTEANSFKSGSREDRVHRLTLELLRDEPSFRNLDRYQSEKAFDDAWKEANGAVAMTLKGVEVWGDSMRAKRMGMPVPRSMTDAEREEHRQRVLRAHAAVQLHQRAATRAAGSGTLPLA